MKNDRCGTGPGQRFVSREPKFVILPELAPSSDATGLLGNDWGRRLHTLKIVFAGYIELWRGMS
jgi:hypothetical protein